MLNRKKKIFIASIFLMYLIPFMWILLCSEINYTFSFGNPEKGILYILLDIVIHIVLYLFGGGTVSAIGIVISIIVYHFMYGSEFDSEENKKFFDSLTDLHLKLAYPLFFVICFMEYTSFATIKFT